jgi:isoleucyl-tRNA synthetase
MMFKPLPAEFSFPRAEQQVLEFWERHQVFQRSLAQRAGAPRFVFYEGPPTANGLPHPGHCLTRAIKDLFPRYQTMRGRLVERKAGWDTHGLPVEVEVCKELGIHTKEEIEAYGVEKFVRKCIESVFRYTREWEQMTRRLGFWVNLEDAYVTYHQSYVESVWWGLQQLFDRGLLYQGHKVVWWWAQGGTALSAGEVGEGYRTVQDPSVYVKFPLAGSPDLAASFGAAAAPASAALAAGRVALLVWTTTPWTLISNHFAAVGPDVEYALVHDTAGDEYYIIAAALVADVAKRLKRDLPVVAQCKGAQLVDRRYTPPFDTYVASCGASTAELTGGGTAPVAWRIVPADFIDLATGTGIVHIAPAYGEVDFDLLQRERRRFTDELASIPLLNAVAPNGTFNADAPAAYRGRWVKDCDKDIVRELKERGVLLHQETIEHEYPFCPRAEDDALIQYARQSWFVRTSQFKDAFLANNDAVNWLPDHIKEGRFGDFLRNNVDWALSRERYWGTPLPIWRCEQTGRMEAVGSLAELTAKPGATDATPEYPQGMWAAKKAADPAIPDHLRVHKPYIDAWTYDSPYAAGAKMRRVPEVIDCWWDAGSMPFAQWGFPHVPDSPRTFAERFPADFISEAIDQTRGWFYGLLSISTLLFSEAAMESSLVAGLPAGIRRRAAERLEKGLITPAAAGQLDAVADRLAQREQLPPAAGQPSPEPDVLADVTMANPMPYRACIVLGHVMGEDGLKMSKRKKNYREPAYIFDTYGADAMRWFFYSAQTPWTSIRFQEANIRDTHRGFLVRLYNVFSFFNIYANIDGFAAGSADRPAAATGWRPAPERAELDRWIISELHRTIAAVCDRLDRFENYPAAQRLSDFVDALSNWYVRRSRDRFWHAERDQDKWDAYNTLHEVLLTLSRLLAPFTPFFAETLYQNLTGLDLADDPAAPAAAWPRSVHLCDYPQADPALIDEQLAAEMDLVRDIVSLGRAARTEAKLKVRQPLALAEIILTRPEHSDWLRDHAGLIAEELNIKAVEFTAAADQYVTYQVKPNFKAIGPLFGKLAPQVAKALGELDPAEARRQLTAGGITLTLGDQVARLTESEVEVRLAARPGWSAAQGRGGVVVVRTELTPELIEEGLVRELIHHVQALRREHDLPYQQRITLYVETTPELAAIVARHGDVLARECLATAVEPAVPAGAAATEAKVEGHAVRLALAPAAG